MIRQVVLPMIFGAVLGGAVVDLHLARSSEDRLQQQPPRSLYQQNVPFASIDPQVFNDLMAPMLAVAYACGLNDGAGHPERNVTWTLAEDHKTFHWAPEECDRYQKLGVEHMKRVAKVHHDCPTRDGAGTIFFCSE